MNNYYKYLFLLIVIFLKCSLIFGNSKIFNVSQSNKSFKSSKIMVRIFESCKKEYSSILCYHENDSENILNYPFWSSLFSSVIFLNEMSMINREKKLYESKIDTFIFIVQSKNNLEQVLLNFGSISWWDIMAPFYILDESRSNCTGLFKVFNVINSIGLLKAYYICKNSEDRYLVYTFNPFTVYAPPPWKKYEDPSADHLVRWVLYSRSFNEGTLCDGFDFDRTRYLDGYLVKAGRPAFKDSDIPMFTYHEDMVREKLMKEKLNVVFKTYPLKLPTTTAEKNHSELYDAFYLIHENKTLGINILPTLVNYVNRWSFQNTFPVSWANFGILAHYRGFKTPVEKIKDFYGIWILISMILVLSSTFVVIWLTSTKKIISLAAFDILRLLINASVYAKMDKLSLRVFFSMIFIYFLVIHATFSGHLAEFLTKPELRKLPETLDDLKNPIYKTIVVSGLGASIIIDPVLIEKTEYVINQYDCIYEMLNNASVVCIDNYDFLLRTAIGNNLHLNQHPFNLRYYTHLIRKHWNLYNYFNNFYMIMMEFSLNQRIDKEDQDQLIISLKMETAKNDNYIRALDLKDLDFAFIVLGIGLTSAIICFIIEYVYFSFKQFRTTKVIVL